VSFDGAYEGDEADEGGVFSDRVDRDVPLSEEREDDIDRLFSACTRI
jgi:hypothetical protein